jgi:flagellar biosynthesis GTPase FlhF
VKAQLQKEAVLSNASINLFYHPWKRLLTEVFRRLTRRDYNAREPGGKEAVEFRKRLLKRGVPEEAIHRVINVEPVRAIGYGSPAMRMAAIDETMSIFGSLDEMGRINLLRDRIAARFGQEVVDRYLPTPETGLRPPIDTKIAILENSTMVEGNAIPVSPGENHFLHAQTHLQALDGIEAATVQGQNNPQQALMAMQMMIPHLGDHLSQLGSDLVRKDQVAMMRQRLQQLSATAKRVQDELQAQMENQQKAQMAEAERQQTALMAEYEAMKKKLAESQQLSPEAQQRLMERQAELQMKIERHQADLKMKDEQTIQKLALKDAETAAKIRAMAPPTAAAPQVPEV